MNFRAIFALKILIFLMSMEVSAQNEYLDSLIYKAIEVSPALKQLEYKREMAGYKVPQNSNLPDPMLSLGLMNLPLNSFSFNEEPMTGKIVGLSQMIPFPGKLNTSAEVQKKDVEINEQEIHDLKNEIVKDVSTTYFNLRFMREAIRIANKDKKILESIAEIVRTKYSVSTASQQSIIQIELEITKISDKIEELKGKERGILAEMNSYLLRDPQTDIIVNAIPEIPEEKINFIDLITSAKINRPFLKGIKKAEEKANLIERLSEYEYYPDFNFSIQYTQRDRIDKTNTPLNDFLSFMVGINLPLNYGGKKSAKIEEAKLMQNMYLEQYNAAIQILNKNFGVIIANINSYKQREKLIKEGLLPQAEQSFNAALANYQVGAIDLINVLDAQSKIYEIETNLYEIRTMYFNEISRLEFLSGVKVKNY